MAVTRETSGTLLAADHDLGVDEELAAPTTAGTRELRVNLVNLALTEFVRITVEVKVLSGDTAAKVYMEDFQGGRSDPVVTTTPVATADGGRFLIQQLNTSGATKRDFKWAVMKLD